MLVRTFPGESDQVARARKAVREFLNGMPGTDDVVLVVSELAANAILHSRSRDGEFTVTAGVYHGYVYVEVLDDGGPWFNVHDAGDGPHGLDIVSALTGGDWGIDLGGDRQRPVWARVRLAAAPAAGLLLPGVSPFASPVFLERLQFSDR